MPSSRQSFAIDTIFGVVAVASIPKCGQHSLVEMSKCIIQREDLYNYDYRIAFTRDPLDRLRSAYHFYMQRHITMDGIHVTNWPDFIDWALVSNDEHVTPQSEFIRDDYNILVKLEAMTDFMRFIRFKNTPKLNTATRDIDVNETYRVECIKHKYSADYDLHERALG